MDVIKFNPDISTRNISIEWWNSLSEDKRIALMAEFEVLILTGQAIQQMYSNQILVVIQRTYTKEEFMSIIEKYDESSGVEFKQYLIHSLT